MGRRAAFDPLRSYEAVRHFKWKGKDVSEGEAFTDCSDMRRMRQMYDSRFIRIREGEDSGAPGFARMSVVELRQWLTDHGQPNLAHPRATRERLLERCRRMWLQEVQPNVTVGHVRSEGSGEGLPQPAPPRSDPEGSRVERERIR